MISAEQRVQFLESALDEAERGLLEAGLAQDEASLSYIIGQREMDRTLRSILGNGPTRTELKQSIMAAVSAAPVQHLRDRVLADTTRQEHWSGAAWRSWATRLRPVLMMGCSVVALGLLAWWIASRQVTAPGVEIGRVTTVVGVPLVYQTGQRTASEIRVDSNVRLGDRLETGDADRAELQFLDGTTLRLHFNTIVTIGTPSAQRPGSGPVQRPAEIQLLTGQVWTKVQKTTNPAPYAVRTEVATAVARGTEFGVRLSRPTNVLSSADSKATGGTNSVSVLTVKEGVVDFTNAFGTVQATAMTESTARAGSAPTEPKRLQTLEVVRFGDRPDWTLVSSQLDWPDAAQRFALGGGWAGLTVGEIPAADPIDPSGLDGATRVRVTQVNRASPAAVAGVMVGDVIRTIDGKPVRTARDVHKAFLLRSDTFAELTLDRGGQEMAVTLSAQARAPLLPGPTLSEAEREQLLQFTRQQFEQDAANPQDPFKRLRGTALKAAAHNNVGVILEAADAMGPAIRAYNQAVQAAPKVPLYRFNLALALQKIGSLERALEELQIASRLTPESTEARKWLADVLSGLGYDNEALAQADSALGSDPRDHGLWELKTRILSREGRHAEAAEAARKAVETEPSCPTALSDLAGALSRQGEAAEAEQTYRSALQLSPFSALLHMNLGATLSERGALREAEQHLRRAIELQPDFVLPYRHLGDVLGGLRQFGEAEGILKRAAELDPEDVGVVRDLAHLALQQGQLDLAESHLKAALAVSPHEPNIYFALGKLRLRQARLAEAEELYRKAIELDLDNPASWQQVGHFYRDVLGKLDKAEELYRKSIALAPHRASPYSDLGRVSAMQGNLDAAERLMRQACELDPADSGMHNNVGEVLRLQGKLDQASESFRKALELAPNNASARNNLAICYAQRGEFAEAEAMFRVLVEAAEGQTDSNYFNFVFNLAAVCREQRKWDEAEKFLRKAKALAPNSPNAGRALAHTLADAGKDLDEALLLSRQAVEAAPDDANNVNTLGWVLFQRGELKHAEQTLERALQLAGEAPVAQEIRENLKRVHEQQEGR